MVSPETTYTHTHPKVDSEGYIYIHLTIHREGKQGEVYNNKAKEASNLGVGMGKVGRRVLGEVEGGKRRSDVVLL